MKIGLIGAPGSGKSKLAQELSVALDHLPVIDGYTESVSATFDWALGKYATYAGHIAVALERYSYEVDMTGFVTAGTMIDTVTHMAAMAHIAPDRDDTRRLTGGLVVLGCMLEDLFEYDHLFYLPLTQPSEDEYVGRLANGLEEALTIFDAKYSILPNPETRLADALNAIHEAAPTDER